MMNTVLAAMKTVTVQAPDKRTMELFWMMRRLYIEPGAQLTLAEKVSLARGFAEGFAAVENEPHVHELMERVRDYSQSLQQWAITDHRVSR